MVKGCCGQRLLRNLDEQDAARVASPRLWQNLQSMQCFDSSSSGLEAKQLICFWAVRLPCAE